MNLNLSPLVDWQLDMATNHHLSLKMRNVHKIFKVIVSNLLKYRPGAENCKRLWSKWQPTHCLLKTSNLAVLKFRLPVQRKSVELSLSTWWRLQVCIFAYLHVCIFACLHVIVWTKENILQQKDEIRKRRRDWRAALGFVQQQLNHWQLKDRLNVADGPEPWVWDGMIECSPAARVDSLSCQVDELVVLHLDNKIRCSLLLWTRKLRWAWKQIWVCNT